MIERYFSQAKVLIRLRSGSVGPYLPRFVSALEQRRFTRDTIRRYIRGADRLCRWLDKQGVAVVEANQGHVERYVRRHTRLPDIHYAAQGRLCKAALSVPFIATVLREQGILSGSAPVSNADAWLARFDNHLMRVHGLAQLNLNDIDWIEGEIHVQAGKSRRERTLPLLQEVGKALGVYLREERPESAERSVSLLGLLASSGIRPGEALNLTVRDVLLDLNPPRLQIHKAKFRKSRLVPIHQTSKIRLHNVSATAREGT